MQQQKVINNTFLQKQSVKNSNTIKIKKICNIKEKFAYLTTDLTQER